MIDERVENLHQVGQILIQKYNGKFYIVLMHDLLTTLKNNNSELKLTTGTFVDCVKLCNGSAEQLLKLIVNDFECFRDEADFHGHRGNLS